MQINIPDANFLPEKTCGGVDVCLKECKVRKTLFVLALVAVVAFAGCELFMPTVLVSGSVYTSNSSSATFGQLFEGSAVYAVVIKSTDETALGGDTVADLNISSLVGLIAANGGVYGYPLTMTTTGNDDYGPIEVSMSGNDYYRVLFIEDVDGNDRITADDAIVGASDTSLNVYSSGEETGTDSVTFYWDLVVDTN